MSEAVRGAEVPCSDVHNWFVLSYAQYLTLPRSLLDKAVLDWQRDNQARVVAAIKAATAQSEMEER